MVWCNKVVVVVCNKAKQKIALEKKETVFLEGGMYVQLAHRLFISLCVCVCVCVCVHARNQANKSVSPGHCVLSVRFIGD